MPDAHATDLDDIRSEFGLRTDWSDLDTDDVLDDDDIAAIRYSGISIEQRTAQFQGTIKNIYAKASQLPSMVNEIEATSEGKYLQITVGANGNLKAVAFKPAARGVSSETLNEAFLTCYSTATQQASQALFEALRGFRSEVGVAQEERDIEELFDQTLAGAEAALERLSEPKAKPSQ